MKIIVEDTYAEMSRVAYAIFEDNLRYSKVLGFATGSTPIELYRIISSEFTKGLTFRNKETFNLDEYYPIEPSDKNSYRYFMEKNLFNNIDLKKENINFPNTTLNEEKAVLEYSQAYKKLGPIDMQILGIGINGHIGFNEPGSEIDSVTRIVNLSKETISRNSTDIHRALTIGMKEILESRLILLLASGKDKADAVKAAVEGKQDKSVPASFLQSHKNAIFVLDSDAAGKLK